MATDPIDRYIYNAAPFAIPILEHLRGTILSACPDAVQVMKWSFPHFMYNDKILCSMAAFKNHCAFGFWLSGKMKDPAGILQSNKTKEAMGNLGKITSLKDLPTQKILKAYIKEAMKLIDQGEVLEKKPVKAIEVIEMPKDFQAALRKNLIANDFYKSLSASQKKEYLQWVLDAKKDETRARRIVQAVELLSESKNRNWKYESKNKSK